MKVHNPHTEEISMTYKGVTYSIPAGKELPNVSKEVADHWRTMVHEFIQVAEDTVKAPVAIPTEKKVEIKPVETPKVIETKVVETPVADVTDIKK